MLIGCLRVGSFAFIDFPRKQWNLPTRCAPLFFWLVDHYPKRSEG